jgi:hypothetical protein
LPNPLPYFLVLLIAVGGLAYFRFFTYRSLGGNIVNAYTGDAMAGIPVVLMQTSDPLATPAAPSRVVVTATTGPKGDFSFSRVPARPAISVTVEGYGPQYMEAGEATSLKLEMVPNTLRGTVTDAAGNPVVAAHVRMGPVAVRSGADGSYLIKDAPRQGQVVAIAPGYLAATAPFSGTVTQDLTLQPFSARAIYLSADTIASPTKLNALLDLLERTELNAVVVDVKADNSGTVLYNSNLAEVKEMGTSESIIADLDGLVAQLKRRNIYTIARLSVFWDQALTAAKPELALKSKTSGQPWLDAYGKRWANPHDTRVWDYNISIAEEVASRGFNEVQFDIAYFPSNGDLRDIDFGPDAQGKKDVDAIGGFLDRAHERLSALGAYTSVDVLGLTPFVPDDMGVGQQFDELAKRVDYISPFVYPSDFGDGFLDFAKPAENPADVVANSIRNAVRRAGDGKKVRPWLQDFSRDVPYDAVKVRAQIDAAEDSGAGGWMLWNFNNVYTEGALKSP